MKTGKKFSREKKGIGFMHAFVFGSVEPVYVASARHALRDFGA